MPQKIALGATIAIAMPMTTAEQACNKTIKMPQHATDPVPETTLILKHPPDFVGVQFRN
jgi:hypothetical protein